MKRKRKIKLTAERLEILRTYVHRCASTIESAKADAALLSSEDLSLLEDVYNLEKKNRRRKPKLLSDKDLAIAHERLYKLYEKIKIGEIEDEVTIYLMVAGIIPWASYANTRRATLSKKEITKLEGPSKAAETILGKVLLKGGSTIRGVRKKLKGKLGKRYDIEITALPTRQTLALKLAKAKSVPR